MQLNWSLKALYSGFDAENFKSDLLLLEREIETLDVKSAALKEVTHVESYFRTLESIKNCYQLIQLFKLNIFYRYQQSSRASNSKQTADAAIISNCRAN